MNRVASAVEFYTLMTAGEKTCSPLPGGDGLWVTPPHARHDHKSRKVLTIAAEAIVDPSAHRGATTDGRPGVHEGMRRVVIDLLGEHRFYYADLVSHFSMVGKEVGDELSFAELLEFCEVTLNLEMLTL